MQKAQGAYVYAAARNQFSQAVVFLRSSSVDYQSVFLTITRS